MWQFHRIAPFVLVVTLVTVTGGLLCAAEWYKGQTHCHSFWSDGDTLPELVAQRYKSLGYDFVTMSDHNVLMRGERWRDMQGKRPVKPQVLDEAHRLFGPNAVELRGEGDRQQIRLKSLAEIRQLVEEPGEFLMIEAEEITGKCGSHQVHVNAINLAETILPQEGQDIVDTLNKDLAVVNEQAQRLGRPIFTHINHPGWPYYDIRPEDLAAVEGGVCYEVSNTNHGSRLAGDKLFGDTDKTWDIANTLRVGTMKTAPYFGVATDDTHHYYTTSGDGIVGRGWIVVRAEELSTPAILAALQAGDFYASTGIELRDLDYDAAKGTYTVEVVPEDGVNYTVYFYGTMKDYDRTTKTVEVPDYKEVKQRPTIQYSDDVGQILAEVKGTKAVYKMTGNELYVRAVVVSDKPMKYVLLNYPSYQRAWCQPVGWKKWVTDRDGQ